MSQIAITITASWWDAAIAAAIFLIIIMLMHGAVWWVFPRKIKPDEWENPDSWGNQDFDSRRRKKTRP